MAISGIEALLHMLSEFGVRHIFGNPGTTELPLNDALARDFRIQYILGLQEVPVMAMADGYAMASGGLGVVNLHACCGLGNAMGQLYNAFREGTPLLVTAGQQDRRLRFEEPILGGDMVGVTRPWTRWSAEVERIEDLPRAIRRAVQTALTPPTGPVFLSLPLDLQMERSETLDLTSICLPDHRVRPPAAALEQAADVLAGAGNPAILAGSRVTERGAVDALVALAERLGAAVYGEAGAHHGRLAFPSHHPLYCQGLPLWSPEVRERLWPHDVLLVAGMDLLRQYVYHEPARAIPEHVRLVHLDESPWQLGKNYPVEVGVLGDTAVSLAELDQALARRMNESASERASERLAARAAQRAEQQARLRDEIARQRNQRPLTPLAAMAAVAAVLPPDAAVIEEAVTTTNQTLERLGALRNTSGYFGQRGWTLGWGLGCAVGVKLAWPDRPVLALLGDGAAMYGIQGLWSAAHHRVPVTFVVFNNAQYQILKIGAQGLHLPQARAGQFAGLDLIGPEIDFVQLARSLGVEAERISDADQLSSRLAGSSHRDAPVLYEVPIARG